MLILVSGSTRTMRRIGTHPHLGVLETPNGNHKITGDLPWAADNGCFTGFDEPAYLRMLDRLHSLRIPGCLFVTAPDVVADWKATRTLFTSWLSRLVPYGFPIAYVAQDGQPVSEVP